VSPITQLSMLDHELGSDHFTALSRTLLGSGSGHDVRMNKETSDFIIANNLWYREGQQAHFNDAKKLEFPSNSIEIKADWLRVDSCNLEEFHCSSTADGHPLALIAFHITSRALPNWFWATFEHRKNNPRCTERCMDMFGAIPSEGPDPQPSPALLTLFKDAGLGPEWKNYLLEGSQFDFIDSTGKSLKLGNPWIEIGFVHQSSCITCHARATIDANGSRLPLTEGGQIPLGSPDPNWFFDRPGTPSEQRKFFQLDFVWSLCQAKSRSGSGLNCPPTP
jgi:hypothetical protein